MNQEIIEILKEIKSEDHLDLILPNKLSNRLKSLSFNLYEICLLTEDDFGKINGLGKTKYKFLLEFNQTILEDPSFIILFKKHILGGLLIVPENINSSQSLAKKIFITITEFINLVDEKRNLNFKSQNNVEKISFEVFSECIDLYFGITKEIPLSFEQIAEKYSKSTENIRSSLFYHRNRTDLVDLFLKNEIGYNVKINPTLIIEAIKLIDESLYKPFEYNKFVYFDDSYSDVQIQRLFELFDYRLEQIEIENTNFIYNTILKKDEKVLFKTHFRVIDIILRNGKMLTYNNLFKESINTINLLPHTQNNKYIKENGLNKRMFDIIINEYFKLEIVEEEEQQLYQFKWQYLSSQIDKTTRILYENGGVMSKDEIFEEFQTRENDLGIEFSIETYDFLHLRATDKIHPIGKSGNWFFDENYTKEKNSLAKKVNEDIITIFNGKILFDQFIEFANSKPFYKNYEQSSIRANVLLCAKQSVNDQNLYIHNDFKHKYSEIELKGNRNKYLGNTIIKILSKIYEKDDQPIEKNELVKLVISKLSDENIIIKATSNIYHYLTKFCEIGILTVIEKGISVFFQLDQEELNNHDIEKIGKKQEPEYKKLIRAKAIIYLKENPKVKLSDVFNVVKSIAPVDIAKTNIYKIFNDTSLFIKETKNNEVWISLDTPMLPAPQEMHIEVSEDTTELLGNNPLPKRTLFDTNELKRAIIEELELEKNTYGLNREIVFETFESFTETVLNNERNSIWGRTLVQSIYENFCTKTDIYDRQICVMNLIGSYETFLKLISPLSEQGRVSGIVEIIHSIPEIKDLYYYKNQEKYKITDRQKNNFSHILNRTKYYADLYRHDRSSDELAMGNSKMMKFIVDFTALYLYTLYLVDRY